MVHGFLSSSQYFRRIAADFEHDHTVVRIDLLGHGKSPGAPDYSLDAHVEALRATLESLSLKPPYAFVTHSMGGLVALEYTQQFPDTVERLALLNPPMFAGSVAETLRSIYTTGKLYRALFFWRHRRLLWRLIKLTPHIQHTWRQPINSADILRVPRRAREQGLRDVIIPSDFFAAVDTIDTPALIIAGQQDRAVYHKNLANWQPPEHVSLRVTPHGHHFPALQPRAAAQEIRRFLEA